MQDTIDLWRVRKPTSPNCSDARLPPGVARQGGAGGIPVSLYATLRGIDHRNASLVIKAIAHATGHTNLKADTE